MEATWEGVRCLLSHGRPWPVASPVTPIASLSTRLLCTSHCTLHCPLATVLCTVLCPLCTVTVPFLSTLYSSRRRQTVQWSPLSCGTANLTSPRPLNSPLLAVSGGSSVCSYHDHPAYVISQQYCQHVQYLSQKI